MRIKKAVITPSDFRILIVDDEIGIINSVSVLLDRSGYEYSGVSSPLEAIVKVRNEHYDMLILDYLMKEINGNEVVERIREFDKEIYILLLTGYKDLVPPLETIQKLDIQAYCEKSESFSQLHLLIESAVKSISQMRIIKKYKEGLGKILRILPRIYSLQPLEDLLTEILDGIKYLVDSSNAFILIGDITADESRRENYIFKGTGRYKVQDGEDFFTVLNRHLADHIRKMKVPRQPLKVNGGFLLPVLNEFSQTRGVVYVEGINTEEDLKLLTIYSVQTSSSLGNAYLHEQLNISNNELKKTYGELKTGYIETIKALRFAVDARDVYTRGHSDRVAYFAVKVGIEFGFDDKELELLRISGLFHDIGKISVPDEILLKKSRLEIDEYQEIKKHPVKSADILSAISLFKEVVPIVKYHHERIDGNGYPEGLKGGEIPFMARILQVVDAFDAMISDRQYRLRLHLDEAKMRLTEGAGTQFDKAVVDKFLKVLDNYGQIEEELAHTYK